MRLKKAVKLPEKQSVLLMSLMFQVSSLFYNKLLGVATATELVTAPLNKKEKRSVRLLTSCVEIVTEKDTSELFVSQNRDPHQSQKKSNQLRSPQLLVVFVLTTPTNSVLQVKEVF